MAKKFPFQQLPADDADLLRIACLKENFKYIDFWLSMGGEKVLSAINELDAFYKNGGEPADAIFQKEAAMDTLGDFMGGLYKFGIIFYGTHEENNKTLIALDPFKTEVPEGVTFNFTDRPSVLMVECDNQIDGGASITMAAALPLKPSERILKVDLSRKKSELLDDFKKILGAVEYFRETDTLPRLKENYSEWEPDRSRQRKEAWQQIEIWKLRKQKKPFSEIARLLKITEDAAKQSFYKAYERTQGLKYDPEKYYRYSSTVHKESLKSVCESCPDRPTCSVLCPEALKFVDQDEINLKEKLFQHGLNESLI